LLKKGGGGRRTKSASEILGGSGKGRAKRLTVGEGTLLVRGDEEIELVVWSEKKRRLSMLKAQEKTGKKGNALKDQKKSIIWARQWGGKWREKEKGRACW